MLTPLGWAVIYFGVVFNVGAAWWVYDDARKRKLEKPGAWIPVIAIFGIFGLFWYFQMRVS